MDDEQVYRIDRAILEELSVRYLEPVPDCENISVDEVAWRKRHRYVTNVIDADKHRVIWNAMGRTKDVLDSFYAALGPQKCARIKTVAMDGARAYISSTQEHARNAVIVYDRFHVMKKLNEAVDEVRKDELKKAHQQKDRRACELLGVRNRFVMLKNRGLTRKQTSSLEELCALNEPIYKAMMLKAMFLEVYESRDRESALDALVAWGLNAAASRLEPFRVLSSSFGERRNMVLNWFDHRRTSSISEGFNNKIQRMKRMAYGYKDEAYFLLKVHQRCGLLNPRAPQ